MTALWAAALWCAMASHPVPSPAPERIPLRAMSAQQAIELYTRIVSAGEGTIVATPEGDAVLLQDTPERSARFRRLLEHLDRRGPKGRRLYVRPVLHRLPSELAEVTRRILGDRIGRDVALAPDDRSQQLVVHTRPSTYVTLDRLLKKLDTPPRDEKRIFVLPGQTPIPTPQRRP